jgi:hypothetical protein
VNKVLEDGLDLQDLGVKVLLVVEDLPGLKVLLELQDLLDLKVK